MRPRPAALRRARRRRRARAAALLGAALLLAPACDGGGSCDAAAPGGEPAARTGPLVLYEPFLPAAPGGMAAFYVTVRDTGGAGDRLVGAESAVAGRAMLHRTRSEGGMARMEPAEGGLAVPAGGTLRLAPGGAHVMLAELERGLEPGEHVTVELAFEEAGAVAVEAPVVPYAEAAERGGSPR